MVYKILFLAIIIINLGLPLNKEIDVIFIILTICILFFLTNRFYKILFKKKTYLIIIFSLTIINIFIPKFFTHELHQVFVNDNDINIISKLLPQNITENISKDFKNNFDSNRFINSANWTADEVKNNNYINKPIAFSSDSFFQKNKFSRINSGINFSTRETLRIGQINSLSYNLTYDKHLRRILPFVVMFELDKKYHNSSVCFKGNIFLANSNAQVNSDGIKNLIFSKLKNQDCINLEFNNNYKYLLGYSINEKDNLEIKTKYNFNIIFLKIIKYLLICIILLTVFLATYDYKNKLNVIIYSISAFSTILLTLIRDINLFFGLRYYRGGADGLLHYSYGKDILENLLNKNFYLFFQGGENIFYFMPGLRYFSSFNNLLFGETSYGYLISCTFIPLLIFKIFEIFINKKIAIYLFISFIFLPIFENMGFGYFNYVWQYARHHAETLAILLLLYAFYLIIIYNKNNKINCPSFLIGILLSLSVFLRPNFFPTSIIFLFLIIYLLYKNNRHMKIFSSITGYSLIFICLIHNYYFGNSIVFFTQAAVNFKLDILSLLNAMLAFIMFDFENNNFLILKSQLIDWNPLYNLHRVIILFFITFIIFLKKHGIIYYALFLSLISQHGVLLLSHPSSRYAYLAWLITFILFIYSISKIKIKKV